ncbi:hypothetical protein Cob_v006642 [Colletotrichum orbiculare MAFF 240422]|uniref:Uncharacterized protein n=1 Tax=Colletotrichum orbiculare (strain 104-T / ATCC 96160 / CBS 514.97 / LARS 414 / MAFF 240422) TaxID=1213857 RepID=A0A484FPP1_COLOR|nr:hypothetical protein Cob_v006642 [Colletotrichum orbiculare MAFF 240422]
MDLSVIQQERRRRLASCNCTNEQHHFLHLTELLGSWDVAQGHESGWWFGLGNFFSQHLLGHAGRSLIDLRILPDFSTFGLLVSIAQHLRPQNTAYCTNTARAKSKPGSDSTTAERALVEPNFRLIRRPVSFRLAMRLGRPEPSAIIRPLIP